MSNLAINNVIKALEAKNVEFELYGETTRVMYANGQAITLSTDYNTMLGVDVGKGIWAWFKVYIRDNAETMYSFDHRYNRNTGHTIKGFRTGWKIQDKIKAQTGIDLRGI